MGRKLLIGLGALALAILGLLTIIVLATPGDLNVIEEDTSEGFVYFFMFACIVGDAIIPLLPGESVVNAAAVLASEGKLQIQWVVVAACAGAVIGDNALYWIARLSAPRVREPVERLKQDTRVQTVISILGERAPLFIVLGRYVPGVRFFVNASLGIEAYPYRQFLLWSTIGGVLWGTYTALLAYWVGNALSGYPIASYFIAGGITTVLILLVFWWDRRHRSGDDASLAETAVAD